MPYTTLVGKGPGSGLTPTITPVVNGATPKPNGQGSSDSSHNSSGTTTLVNEISDFINQTTFPFSLSELERIRPVYQTGQWSSKPVHTAM